MIERLCEIVSLPSWELALIVILSFISGSFQEWLMGTRPCEKIILSLRGDKK